jgi:hypothetical protein
MKQGRMIRLISISQINSQRNFEISDDHREVILMIMGHSGNQCYRWNRQFGNKNLIANNQYLQDEIESKYARQITK